MGCLLQSIIVGFIFLLMPVLFLMSYFGRIGRSIFSRRTTKENDEPHQNDYTENNETESPERVNKPIDQSTVEYIDFEEVQDK